MMWRGIVALLIVLIPVLAVYTLGNFGIIYLPDSMTIGLPEQLLTIAAFTLIFALIVWSVGRQINNQM